MICSKCGKECYAVTKNISNPNGSIAENVEMKAFSSCCNAEIDLTDDYSKDQFQGNWHNYPTTGSVTGYPKSEITLRDAIAIAAMQGFISLQVSRKVQHMDTISKWAYEQADSMLKERNK